MAPMTPNFRAVVVGYLLRNGGAVTIRDVPSTSVLNRWANPFEWLSEPLSADFTRASRFLGL